MSHIDEDKHSHRPAIEWDESDSIGLGGFRVTRNLENFILPIDWEADPSDPSHFLPKYKPCKYRRLSKGTHLDRPWCKIHCLLFEEVVDHQTCIDCDQCVTPPQYVPPQDVTNDEDDEDELEDLYDINFHPRDEIPTEHYFDDVDPVFSLDQPPSKYITKPKRRTKWKPCIHRIKAEEDDCTSCEKFACNCKACPLFRKVLIKKDCKECKYRKEN